MFGDKEGLNQVAHSKRQKIFFLKFKFNMDCRQNNGKTRSTERYEYQLKGECQRPYLLVNYVHVFYVQYVSTCILQSSYSFYTLCHYFLLYIALYL